MRQKKVKEERENRKKTRKYMQIYIHYVAFTVLLGILNASSVHSPWPSKECIISVFILRENSGLGRLSHTDGKCQNQEQSLYPSESTHFAISIIASTLAEPAERTVLGGMEAEISGLEWKWTVRWMKPLDGKVGQLLQENQFHCMTEAKGNFVVWKIGW